VNKTKTLKMKLIYIVAAVAMLAMLIPSMALPVSAADDYELAFTITDPVAEETVADEGYNLNYTEVTVTLMDGDEEAAEGTVTSWTISPITSDIHFVGDPNSEDPIPTSVVITGIDGQTEVTAYYKGGKAAKTKKWAEIDGTTIGKAGKSTLTWNQSAGYYYDEQEMTDFVYGDFPGDEGANHPIQGVLLHWFLVASGETIPASGETNNLIAAIELLDKPAYVEFIDPAYDWLDEEHWLGTHVDTFTDATGISTVPFAGWEREESVQIVVVPEYDTTLQVPVETEVTQWTFEREEVNEPPQVRWIGEKIVIERNFGARIGPGRDGSMVQFTITAGKEGSTLEALDPIANFTSNGESVYTLVGEDGIAGVILTSDEPQEVIVNSCLYNYVGGNCRHVVYFLKLETITLSDVDGKRAAHNDGVWTQYDELLETTTYNPYNKYFPFSAAGLSPDYEEEVTAIAPMPTDDVLDQDRNVSQDALERAQVRGWFVGVNDSSREKAYVDSENADRAIEAKHDTNPVTLYQYDADITLPAGRWVLPDDWAELGNYSSKQPNQWKQTNLLWDIMSSPDPNDYANGVIIVGEEPMGPYTNGSIYPVVGPFAPLGELMTEDGWDLSYLSGDPQRAYKTVVPDGYLNAYDCPMPPAEVLFQIVPGADADYTSNGYFKEAMKADIYVDGLGNYTNPFYYELIAAHWLIPQDGYGAGSYLWDSFDDAKGPYQFWTIVQKLYLNLLTETADYENYPTAVKVYSDNHGEAMVWLNGDYNLNIEDKDLDGNEDAIDIQEGEWVGDTYVQATANYPYIQGVEKTLTSNVVVKHWFWGGMILGVDGRDSFKGELFSSTSTCVILSTGEYTRTSNGNDGTPDTDDDRGVSPKHTIFIFACDRDGLATGVDGAKVYWDLSTNATVNFAETNGGYISGFNEVTKGIYLDSGEHSGFLMDTEGVMTGDGEGESYMRPLNTQEAALFDKQGWTDSNGNALKASNFVIAGIEVVDNAPVDATIQVTIESTDFGYVRANGTLREYGLIHNTINMLDIDPNDASKRFAYPLDDPIVYGDANADGVIDAADITAIERIILGLDGADINADANANGSIDMGDVVKVIRVIRGLD